LKLNIRQMASDMTACVTKRVSLYFQRVEILCTSPVAACLSEKEAASTYLGCSTVDNLSYAFGRRTLLTLRAHIADPQARKAYSDLVNFSLLLDKVWVIKFNGDFLPEGQEKIGESSVHFLTSSSPRPPW